MELAGALEAMLAGADAGWDVPLVDPEAPELASTEDTLGMVPRDAAAREAHQWAAGPLRRGQKARRGPASAAPGGVVMAGQAEGRPPSPVAEADAPTVPHDHGEQGEPPALAAPPRHSRPLRTASVPWRGAVALAAGGVLLGALLLAGSWDVKGRTAATPAPVPAVAPLPPGWLASNPTLHAYLVREVAAPDAPSEAGGGAAASLVPPPASTFATMLRKNDARLKSEEKPAPRPQRKALHCVPTRQETCVVGICTLLLTGCTGTPQVVRPPPRPADCPPGALKAMKELGIRIGDTAGSKFPVVGGVKPVTVRESTPITTLRRTGAVGRWTELTGRLYLGPERVYGRFTQARAHIGEDVPGLLRVPVRGSDGSPAWRGRCGGPANSAMLLSTQRVRAVDRFE